MNDLRVETVRGPLVESVHQVSAVVVDADGRRVAWSGDPDMVTFWRSSAKPFQAIPLVDDGAADRFGFSEVELALACASHSSEPVHLETVDRMLAKIGCHESDLACGGHPPLSEAVAQRVARDGAELTPRWSNCSGNHAGMLALAVHHGWPVAGYNRRGHPVQDRVLEEVSRWTDVPVTDLQQGLDGCDTVCFGLPLANMALAYARLGVSAEPAVVRVREAMTGNPAIVGGVGRPCTDIMSAAGGTVVAKIGAEGVYGASVIGRVKGDGLGIALKVRDGGMRSAPIGLIAILQQLEDHGLLTSSGRSWLGVLEPHATVTLTNTKGLVTGELRSAGELHVSG